MRHIVSDKNYLRGKPYLGGVKITVQMLLEELLEGKTMRDIVRKYPQLQEDDIAVILNYAIRVINAHPEDADIQRPELPNTP